MNEKEILAVERHLSEYDLSEWEKDILIEFNKSKDIEDFLDYIKTGYIQEFLINLGLAKKSKPTKDEILAEKAKLTENGKLIENIKLAPLTPLPDFEYNAFKFTPNGVEYYQLNNKM